MPQRFAGLAVLVDRSGPTRERDNESGHYGIKEHSDDPELLAQGKKDVIKEILDFDTEPGFMFRLIRLSTVK